IVATRIGQGCTILELQSVVAIETAVCEGQCVLPERSLTLSGATGCQIWHISYSRAFLTSLSKRLRIKCSKGLLQILHDRLWLDSLSCERLGFKMPRRAVIEVRRAPLVNKAFAGSRMHMI